MSEVVVAKAAEFVVSSLKAHDYRAGSLNRNCPDCDHCKTVERNNGVPLIGSFVQESCACRIVRQKHDGNYPCGCEWTEDHK